MDTGEIQRAIEALPAGAEQELLLWLKHRATARRRISREPLHTGTLRSAVLWTALTLLTFFGLEGALFHSGWYSRYLEPDSSAGFLEGHMTWLGDTRPGDQPEIFVIGDSRTAEGLSSRAAATAAGGRYAFWNLAVPGTDPRIWFYMLRDAVGSRPAPAAVVIGLDRFSDVDGGEKPQSRVSDLNYLTGRLRLNDCFDFARSMEAGELWSRAFGGCLFRGVPLRGDLHDMLLHWKSRRDRARDFRIHGHGYIDGYGGKPEVLTGLTADVTRKEIHFPPDLKDWQRDSVQNTLLPASWPQTGDQYRFRQLWLGRILGLFRGTKTRVVFVEMPRGPLPLPDSDQPARFLNEALREGGVSVLPQDTFHDLERPELFADGLHLNREGRAVFSQRLGENVARIMGAGH